MENISLEKSIVKYKDLINIKVRENNEQLVKINKVLNCGYVTGMDDMKEFLGNKILVRKTVLNKLKMAQKNLSKIDPNLFLFITYGYRSLKIQTKKFLEQIVKIGRSEFFTNPFDLYEKVHRSIAVPNVAGHPTGGAIDITIINNGSSINFGSRIYDFSFKSYTFEPSISKKCKNNRLLLRKLLIEQEFAPFDGEWWHFSYGDKEWAFYYKMKFAIYSQINLENIK